MVYRFVATTSYTLGSYAAVYINVETDTRLHNIITVNLNVCSAVSNTCVEADGRLYVNKGDQPGGQLILVEFGDTRQADRWTGRPPLRP